MDTVQQHILRHFQNFLRMQVLHTIRVPCKYSEFMSQIVYNLGSILILEILIPNEITKIYAAIY